MKRERLPIIVLIIFVGIFLAPIVVLLTVPIGTLPIRFDGSLLFSGQTVKVLMITAFYTSLTNIVRTPLVFLYGWIVNRTDVPGRFVFDSIGLAGLTIPEIVKAVGWLIMLNPVNGLLNEFTMRLLHLQLMNVFTPVGLSFASIWSGIPIVYLISGAAIKNIDPSLEEASRASGHSLLRTFLGVSLPSLRQMFLIVFVTGLMVNFALFDIPIVLAPPGGYNVMSTYLEEQATEVLPPNYGAAATLGIILLVIALSLFAIYLYLTRKTFMFQVIRGTVSRFTVHPLRGAGRWIAFSFCSFIVVMSFVLPFAGILLLAFTIPGRITEFTAFSNFNVVLNLSLIQPSFLDSILVGAVSAIIAAPLGLLLGYAVFKSRFRASRILETIVILPRGIPDLVFGLAVFLTFIFIPGLNLLYGTIVPFVIAVVVITTPQTILIQAANVIQIGDELEDASRVGGATWSTTFLKIIAPLCRRAFLNSLQYTFIENFREVAPFILLVTPTFYLLLPLVLNVVVGNPAAINYASAASVLITLFLSGFLLAFKLIDRFLERRSPSA